MPKKSLNFQKKRPVPIDLCRRKISKNGSCLTLIGFGNEKNRSKRSPRPKWKTLRHNGPLFPEPYKRLPKNVNLIYAGKRFPLSKNAEEAATMYARFIYDPTTKQKTFQENFFKDWKKVMSPKEIKRITDFKKCNFEKMYRHLEEQSALKRERNMKNKLSLLKKRQAIEKKYGYCLMDGEQQSIANYKIEPPSIFRGRGKNRRMGRIKPRIQPKDVTLNIGNGERIPKPSTQGSWKEVIHDNQVTWLASWDDQITGKKKYIYTGPSSEIKITSDIEKFEKSRDLGLLIDGIRKSYLSDLQSKTLFLKQRSLALYLIDKLALRVGNETGQESSETFGCCSLLKKHLLLSSDGSNYYLNLQFKSKDSIDFKRKVRIPHKIYKALQDCTKWKTAGEQILDLIKPSELNKYLYSIDRHLTAKVFRTFNSSKVFEEALSLEIEEDMSLDQKLLCLDKAYIAVATLCNHKKAVPKSHNAVMKRLEKRIKDTQKKVKDHYQVLVKDKKKSRACAKLEKAVQQLRKLKLHQERKALTADWNLNTGKQNYIDPRITIAWAKKFNIPLNKIFTAAQRQKFEWAMNTRRNFEF